MNRRSFGTVAKKRNSLVAVVSVKVGHDDCTAEFSVFRIFQRITAVSRFGNKLFNFSLISDCLRRTKKIFCAEIRDVATAQTDKH